MNFKNWYKKTSWKKRIGILVVTVIIGIFVASSLRKKPATYTTETVKRDTITDVVSESGNVTSSSRFDVYPTSTGYIEEMYVQNGDMVTLKQKLFKVKSTATPQEQATAYANYQSAVSTAKTSEQSKLGSQAILEQDRQTVLLASSAVTTMQNNINNSYNNPATGKSYTQNEIDTINSGLTSARQTFTKDEQKYNDAGAAISAAKAAVAATWIAYEATRDSVVIAPKSGTIANFSLSLGDKVVVAAPAAATTPTLVILGDLGKTVIKIPMNEVDVHKVTVGESASIVFDAFRDKTYKGHVTALDTAGTNIGGVITYNATIVVDDADLNVKTEMTATVSVETAKHENVLTVPNSAVKPYKGGKAVIVAGANSDSQVTSKAGKKLLFHYVPVKVGLKGTTSTEVTEGVSEGTVVITSAIAELK